MNSLMSWAKSEPPRSRRTTLDLGPAFAKAFREKAPNAQICLDPFHVVKVRHEAPCIPAVMKGHRLGDVAASQRS
ncbi:transposase [Ferrimicrobium sp.]|uniref:transposase n=2 Tax=Ferrimicrobium sp. TaxID=2926050 RepID=UPI00344CEAB1